MIPTAPLASIGIDIGKEVFHDAEPISQSAGVTASLWLQSSMTIRLISLVAFWSNRPRG
jgi:hypothetical protein